MTLLFHHTDNIDIVSVTSGHIGTMSIRQKYQYQDDISNLGCKFLLHIVYPKVNSIRMTQLYRDDSRHIFFANLPKSNQTSRMDKNGFINDAGQQGPFLIPTI